LENLKRVRFKALLVDDEEEILNLSKTFFEKEGDSLELETASSPKRALKLMEEENFDVVVSDYRMPEMDGIDLWERIKENGDRPSFLLFTGRGDEEVAMKALNRGVDGYIKKKTDFESQFQELKEKIREKAGKRDGSTALEDGYGKSPLLESFDQDCEFPSDEGKLADVLSVLSKRGSFEILKSADSGMRSARGRWNDFGLSKKQYYTRLRSLQEADLLDKEVDEYRTTGRGRKVLNLLFLLGVTVGDPDDMEGMEPGEVESVERRGLNELLGNGSDDLQLKEFESVGDYEPFVERANGLIADAERDLSIFLTFSDRRILNSLLRANEDVEIRILMPEQPLTNLKGI